MKTRTFLFLLVGLSLGVTSTLHAADGDVITASTGGGVTGGGASFSLGRDGKVMSRKFKMGMPERERTWHDPIL